MSFNVPFSIKAPNVVVTATTSSGSTIVGFGAPGCNRMMIKNEGAVTIYITTGNGTAPPVASAASMPILANEISVYTKPPEDNMFAVLAETSTAKVNVICGEGE